MTHPTVAATCSALFLAALVGGCGGGAPDATPPKDGAAAPPTGESERGPRDTLVIGAQNDIGYLISVVQESVTDNYILTNLSYPLVDVDFDCSLKKEPGIATEWSWSDDGKILSMTLRDDLTFEDGNKVGPEDIAFTWELVADPKVGSPRVPNIERMVVGANPKIIDDTHIEWHFTEAYDRDTQMSHASSLSILPKHLLADADRSTLRGHAMAKAPVAYGPWRLAKWEPNSRIVLEPNPAFTGPEESKPRLNRVIFRILPEYSTRLIELETGKIDMMMQLQVADAYKLKREHPEIRLVRRGWRSNDYVAWNLTNPLFSSKEVRQALAQAVDVDSMIAKLLTSESGESYGRRSVGNITPALCGVHNDDIVPYAHDKEKAKAMLASAGWTDSDGDGILDRGGKRFAFTLTTNTGNPRRSDIQVLVQAQLRELGIEVNLEQVETNAFYERMRKKEFEATVAGWSAALFVDPSSMWHCDTPERKYEFNFTSYCNPEVDALIENGLSTPNPEDSAPLWKELQVKIYEDQPYLFLWWQDEIVAIHERFENTVIDELSPLNHLERWEVPANKVKYKR